MNSTDPRPNGFRGGRMPSTRNRPAAAITANSQNSTDSVQVAPLNVRGRAAGTAGATGTTTYAYTFAGPGGSNRPGRIASAADSNYRYEYYRDYLSNPASPALEDGGNNRGNGGGGGGGGGSRGGGGGNRGSGNGNGNGNRGDKNNNTNNNRNSSSSSNYSSNNNNNDDNGGRFQHHISFSFNVGGASVGATPEVNFNSFGFGGNNGNGNNGGGLFGGLPVNLPMFGSGFPFGQGVRRF